MTTTTVQLDDFPGRKTHTSEATKRLISSMRGRMIIGTALHMAIKELEKVEGAMRQYSTIEDMRSMLDSDIFINIHDDEE